MNRYMKGIHKVMKDDYSLADTYAQDGAFHSAADVLKRLSEKVKEHAVDCDRFLLPEIKINDFVRLKRFEERSPDAIGRVTSISRDKKMLHVSAMNMPFYGSFVGWVPFEECTLVTQRDKE